jgi:hypothetical protein
MPMPCTCFISYPHVDAGFFRDFVEELHTALQDRIRLLKRDANVILDFKRLQPGFIFDETISKDICRAVCMVVVYVPAYDESPYCLREFEAMEQLQERRRSRLNRSDLADKGMIIPIIFRGDEKDLPARIAGRYQYLNLSKITPRSGAFLRQKNSQKLDDIATRVIALYRAMEANEPAICGDCDAYSLPPERDLRPWRAAPAAEQAFPR